MGKTEGDGSADDETAAGFPPPLPLAEPRVLV